jgi:hypothetical protein
MNPKQKKVGMGYLLILSPSSSLFLGGLMVTDERGLPMEFRYTEPIQPSKIQQVLYGGILSRYIKQDIILETLLKNCESRLSCLIVEDESLLEADGIDIPLFRVLPTKSAPIGLAGTIQECSPEECLLQVSSENNPVRVMTTLKSRPDNNSQPSASASQEVPKADPFKLLLDAGQSMDITEPLDRVRKALDIICQEMKQAEKGDLLPTALVGT